MKFILSICVCILLYFGSARAGETPTAVKLTPSQAQTTPTPAKVAEFKYPPIRLEVPEATLNASLKKTKEELIQSSQVFEDGIHPSGAIYHDAELDKVLNSILPVDQLGDRAKGFHYRIYVVRDPTVNAMTTPTGSIYINMGFLAALENTDQLRLTLGHEVHHILDQDIVHKFKKLKHEVGSIKMLQLIVAPVVAVAIGESDADTGRTIANVYTAANVAVSISYQLAFLGYGRENENECDLFALKIFNQNQYDLQSAKRTFQVFEDEHKKYGKGFHSHYFNDHETGKQRAERVQKFMKEVGHKESAETGPKADLEYYRLTHEARVENARLNVRVKRPHHAIEDLEELGKIFPDDARIPCLLGQVYAMISKEPKLLQDELSSEEWKKQGVKDKKKHANIWEAKAAEYFAQSIAVDPAYAEPYRELGLLNEVKEKYSEALRNFEKYLELNPQGKDARYVRSKITKVKESQTKKESAKS